ncbi:hypothetical protein KDA23_07220 [Candidatus Saccharibacteria bacterium]|nr:hypothetical protein [Candidatus Saccharibacteria bacterium]
MWWNIRFNRQDPNNPGYLLVPAPNAKEVAYRQERDFLGAVQSAKTDLVVQYRTRHTAIILVVNSKGGGSKTTTTNWSATGMRIETGCEVTVMDSNWASGNAAQRLRFRKDETIYDRMVVDNFGLLSRDHNTYVGQVKANTDGVRCIAAKRVQKGGSGKLNAGEYGGLAKLAFANCEYLWIDTPNDITSDQFLMLAQMATVIVFTANVAEPDSLRQLGESMQVLRDFGLEDKVNRSVVVINNLPPGKTANDYRKYQHEVDIHNNDEVTTEFPGHKGPWMGIRHDPAMADARQVDWSALRRETAQDIRLLNIAVLKCVPLKPVLKELPKSQGTPAQPTAPPTSVPPERSAVVTPPSGDATPGPVQRPTQRFATILSEFTDPTTGADGHTETA